MNISKKWSAAAASALALALVVGGAVSANAATGDVLLDQSNGSKTSYYMYDGNGVFTDGDPTRVFGRGEMVFGSASKTDILAELNPAATRPVTGAAPFTGVYKFLSDRNPADRDGGTNTWNAYAYDSAAGPNGGTLTPDLTLEGLTNGIETVIAAGGEYWFGIAYTNNAGVTTVGAVYRNITIEKGTGNYTVGAVEVEAAPAPPAAVTEADLTAGNQVSTLVTETVDSKVLAIDAGVANANKTLTVGSFPAGLTGQVTLDANGAGTVDAAAIPVNQATKLYLANSDNTIVAWDSFTLTQSVPTSSTTNLSAEVTTSNRFELVAPANASVNLGTVRRDKVTAPVKLGQFSVYDDRNVLKGWNLNVTASDFTNAVAGKVIAKDALGYKGIQAGGIQDGVELTAGKAAGVAGFGTLATAAIDSSTAEAGAHFDADLTFKAPKNAVKGVYNGTLTLDLVSK
ncbi:hypothetical protein [Mycetocola sp.]|uniref:hypothetical protein n=1 Tax=Mycetocola sp. TaxID=1871042 RepID=UPI003989CD73